MAFDTFPDIPPAFGAPEDTECNILATSFGDGYGQEAANGLNHIRRGWSLTWNGLTKAQADTIINFLIAKGGYTPFLWKHEEDAADLKWTCKQWQRTPEETQDCYRVTATFEQSFALG
jgi:phage-related protein